MLRKVKMASSIEKADRIVDRLKSWIAYPGQGRTPEMVKASPEYIALEADWGARCAKRQRLNTRSAKEQ